MNLSTLNPGRSGNLLFTGQPDKLTGMNVKSVHIKNFGCQMNKLDTALVSRALREAGYHLTETISNADAVLINTCSVREHAEKRVLSHLGHLKHIKKTRPEMPVAVFGCMAQRLGKKLLQNGTVDIVCGPGRIPQLPRMLNSAFREKQKAIAITPKIRSTASSKETDELERFESSYGISESPANSQAYVRIMRGCNKFCTYCIVPYVRGPEVSRPPQAVIEQIRKLADEGVKQVTLLGQSVNSYEYKSGGRTYTLADLLYMSSESEGIRRLRFITNYPTKKYYTGILQAMAELPEVCNYLHIPAQSGSNKILKAMNRRYTAESYLDMLGQARDTVPGISLSGDFIVGFPGESEEDFQQTAELVKKAEYKNCFIFKYSPRPDTKADKNLADSIPAEVKKKRNTELLALQEKISDRLSRKFLGRELEVLVEGLSKKPHLNSAGETDSMSEGGENPQLTARTATDHIVVFNGPQSLAGEFARVKITKTRPLTLFAELTDG